MNKSEERLLKAIEAGGRNLEPIKESLQPELRHCKFDQITLQTQTLKQLQADLAVLLLYASLLCKIPTDEVCANDLLNHYFASHPTLTELTKIIQDHLGSTAEDIARAVMKRL